MKLTIVGIAVVFVLTTAASCPWPPDDPAPPGEGWDCSSPPADVGRVVEAKDPVAECYITILSEVEGTEFHSLMTTVVPREAENVEFLPLINGFRSSMPPAVARSLANSSGVTVYECESVSLPEPIGPGTEFIPESVGSWGLDRIDQRDLPLDGSYSPEETGADIHVSINDTGEPFQLGGFNVGEGYSAVGGSGKDDHDHGSHVGGTIGHATYGVAPGATMHWCKSLINGSGSDADVIECIDWFVQICQTNGWMCIGNMSLGGSVSAPLNRAVCASINAGVGWAVAAGNDNRDACNGSPAGVKQAMTIGATDWGDSRASFSNYGDCVDLFAGGVSIRSVGRRGNLISMSGTSMASPHVAGVMALCAERKGSADPEALRDCVLGNATRDRVNDEKGSPDLLAYALEARPFLVESED